MHLLPIDNRDQIDLASGWLSEKRNYQWLDFGNGIQALNPVTLALMIQKENQILRIFTCDEYDSPIGMIGLTNIKWDFRTATIWGLIGEKQYSLKGYASRATSAMLTCAFRDLKLNAVDAWAVSCNHASLRIMKQMKFRLIGVQRQCHIIEDRVYDRILFDMLASEHRRLDDE